jgi:drug/metabolite transporter (DMT)-like permease
MNRPFDTKTLVALSVTLLFWASVFTSIRVGLQDFNPFHLALYRFLVASLVLAVYALITRMRLPEPRDIPVILLSGCIGFTVYHAAINYGEITVTAGATSFLISMSPIFTAILAAVFLGERLTPNAWAGMVIGFLGTALIAFGESGELHFSPGALIVLVATLSFSVFLALQKPLLAKYKPFDLTTYSIWGGTLFLLVFLPGFRQAFGTAPLQAHLTVIYMGVFPTAVAYAAWSFFMSKMPASRASGFLYITPILSTLIAAIWIGEIPSLLSLAGGTITLAGLVLAGSRGVQHKDGAQKDATKKDATLPPSPSGIHRPGL